MSKVSGPLFSVDAAGTVGRAITYGKTTGGQIARKTPNASTSSTAAQLARRQIYIDAVAVWNGYTAPQKAAWQTAADLRNITAFNAYLSDALGAAPPPPGGSELFDYTGADQSWIVPAGVYLATVKLWGAGGAAGTGYPGYTAGNGWSGGFATGVLALTPGESLTIIVGEAGLQTTGAETAPGYGGGGGVGVIGARGGGRSAIRRASAELITAGAGAGGSSGIEVGQFAGNGGGLTALGGGPGNAHCGGPGTPTTGGAASIYNNAQPGVQYAGGRGRNLDANPGTAGGGGGWYGGGGSNIGDAGGGSSRLGSLTSASTTTGTGQTSGGAADPDYVSPTGAGGIIAGAAAGAGQVLITWGAQPDPDPYFANVSLLAFNESGADGTNVFLDLSQYGYTLSASAPIVWTTDTPPTGLASSVRYSAGSHRTQVADATPLRLDGDFTIEFMARSAVWTTTSRFFCGKGTQDYYAGARLIGSNMYVALDDATNPWAGTPTGGANDTWHHVAFCKQSDVWYLFIDGVQKGATPTNVADFGVNGSSFQIGNNGGTNPGGWPGELASFRVTKGIARYTGAFTPPTLPLPWFGP